MNPNLDPFTVTVAELCQFLRDKPEDAKVVVTPATGKVFGVVGWWSGSSEDGQPLVGLTEGGSQ